MPFTFRSQPLRTLYQTYFLTTTLLSLPLYALLSLPPSLRPRRAWPLSRTLIVRAVRAYVESWWAIGFPVPPGSDYAAIATDKALEGELRKVGFEWVDPVREEVVVGEVREVMERQGVERVRRGGYWYQRDGESGERDRKAAEGEKVLLHFHGGGYIVGSPHPAGGPIGPISSVLLAHAPAISRIFAPGYRLSSSSPYPQLNPFPAALIDALAAYHHLIHVKGFDPKNIIVGGDSAGGNLALAVVRYIVREKIGALAVPGALLLLSPTAEWEVTHTGPKASMTTNASSDFCNIFLLSGYTARSLLGSSLPSTFIATSPYISPSSLSLPSSALPGLFAGFPRTYISAGGAEVCLDMYRTLRERMERDIGSGLVYDEEPEGTHDFLTMDWHEPERSETAKRIGKWVEGL